MDDSEEEEIDISGFKYKHISKTPNQHMNKWKYLSINKMFKKKDENKLKINDKVVQKVFGKTHKRICEEKKGDAIEMKIKLS